MGKTKGRGLMAMEAAKAEVRKLVTALHQEVYNLRWNEGKKGEAALSELQQEYESLARQLVSTGIEYLGWNGGILEQAETAEAMARLMDSKG